MGPIIVDIEQDLFVTPKRAAAPYHEVNQSTCSRSSCFSSSVDEARARCRRCTIPVHSFALISFSPNLLRSLCLARVDALISDLISSEASDGRISTYLQPSSTRYSLHQYNCRYPVASPKQTYRIARL